MKRLGELITNRLMPSNLPECRLDRGLWAYTRRGQSGSMLLDLPETLFDVPFLAEKFFRVERLVLWALPRRDGINCREKRE